MPGRAFCFLEPSKIKAQSAKVPSQRKRGVVLVRKPAKIVLMLLLGGSLALASCTSKPSDLDKSLIQAAIDGDTKAVRTALAEAGYVTHDLPAFLRPLW